MRVTLVRDHEALATLKEEWQSILDRTRPHYIFMTWRWLSTWWRHFGHGRELFVLVVRDKGELVGIVPLALYVDRGGRFRMKTRTLHFIGYLFGKGFTDYMDIIAAQKEEVTETVFEYLRRRQHLWDVIELLNIPGDSDTLHIWPRAAGKLRFPCSSDEVNGVPYLSTDSDWESFYGARKKHRRELEGKWKKLQEQGDATIVRVDASDEAAFATFVDTLLEFYGRRRDTPPVLLDTYREFYHGLARVLPADWFRCSLLGLNGKPIAAQFSLCYEHRLYYMTPTYDPDFARFSPGRILLRNLLEDCFRDDRVTEFDFGQGREPYKYEWASGERPVHRLRISNAYMSGKLGAVLRRVPPAVRRLVIVAGDVIGRLPPRRFER